MKIKNLISAVIVAVSMTVILPKTAHADEWVYYGPVSSWDCGGILNFLVAGYGAVITGFDYLGQTAAYDRPAFNITMNVYGFNGVQMVCAY